MRDITQEIKILDDRQQSREKLPIFYGSRDNHVHGVKELIANAADEIKNNVKENGRVEVILSLDGKRISVSDNGRGIPITGETDGYKNYELLFLKLFAGTKYDVTDSITTGTNGVGNTVLNYTSKFFHVESYYDGKKHSLTFENGGKIQKPLASKKSDRETGTIIAVELDEDVYTSVLFDVNEIRDIVKHFAVASLGIEYKFIHGKNQETFLYQSYDDYFSELATGSTTSGVFGLGSHVFEQEVKITSGSGVVDVVEKNEYNIILTTMPEVVQESYLNATFLSEGGAINDGVLDGARLFLNKHCRDNNLFPKSVTAFTKDDVENSIGFIAIVESNNVEFSNQTKLSTSKDLYKNQAKTYVTNLLQAAQIESPKEFQLLVKHLLEVQKHNSVNDRARARLKKKLTEKVEGIGNKVEKLIDCENHGMDSELFITEGDSAMGSIIDARDDAFQATYPLRGKMLNVLKADLDRVFDNQEIVDLVKIIGTGIVDGKRGMDDFDIKSARYGKIIIATDADPDGQQIAILFLTFIYRFMRPLLEAGRVYVAQTPLYEVKLEDDTMHYFISEDDKNKNFDKVVKGKKYVLNRLKGLGELDAQTMHDTTMNPATRNIIQVEVKDVKKLEKMIIDWMGAEVQARKEMISEQLPNYIDVTE